MKSADLKRFTPLIGAGLFILAAVVLYRQLKAYHLHDILQEVHAIPSGRILAALLLMAGSYLVMTGYDLLALRYIRHPLPPAKTALTAFLGYAFSNNIGFSMIAGASVRYRLYSAWGLSAVEITKVVLFCSTSLWLGFSSLSGAVFAFAPLALPRSLHWPVATVRPLGILLLAAALGYWGLTFFSRREWRFGHWKLAPPSFGLAGAQMAIAAADWLMAGAVLYALLPAQLSLGLLHFLQIYLLAQLAGLVSQVPGGLGVFETAMLLLAPTGTPASQLMGALVVYRGIYYLLPLLVATAALGVVEALRQRTVLTRIQSLAGGAVEALFIPLLSLSVFVGGAILMFSGALPAIPHRLKYLEDMLPLLFLELSHFLGSLAGMGLLLLARGLQRRLDGAWLLTMGLLGFGIAASLFKGIDYEEATILAILMLVLLPCRKLFFRKASLLSESFTPGWLAAIAVVMVSSIGLGLFAFRHVEYSNELWWRFSIKGSAPRFLRAEVGALVLALGFAMARLIRPTPYRPPKTDGSVPDAVAAIVDRSPTTGANLAYLGDKQFLINENSQAFIMYGVIGQTWVAMGDPVGPVDQWPELLWQFRQAANTHGDRAVFYEVDHAHLHFYLDMGLTLLKLGEEARVPLTGFSLEGSSRKDLRYIHRKLVKQGCTFEIIPPEAVGAHLDTLKIISDEWLKAKNTREKGFSLGFFNANYLQRFAVGLVRINGDIAAFANIWQSADRQELSVDLMRHRSEAPSGMMDFLFIELMLWGAARDFVWFNLGMAPLSGMESHEMAPLWHRLSGLVVRFGDHFYNFQGLRGYKEKFDPVWRPRYLAVSGGFSLPRTLADIGALISGGFKGILFK
jgi:phosphatidylglycerol lysyltransferase